ncbi:fluoride efflux transporter CrcB [Brucella sp. IR073]|uniref:fluoride efflux transporter CrcB n=1 Tax=unclassified Brucella TaxID=2632610 RepID=UPI003B981812
MSVAACFLVLAGGFVGGVARFALSRFVDGQTGRAFQWGTLAVNISGAFLAGAVAGLSHSAGGVFASEMFRAFVMVGVLGGYTTVSSFALQSVDMCLKGETRPAFIYVAMSAIFSVVAAAAGFALAG